MPKLGLSSWQTVIQSSGWVSACCKSCESQSNRKVEVWLSWLVCRLAQQTHLWLYGNPKTCKHLKCSFVVIVDSLTMRHKNRIPSMLLLGLYHIVGQCFVCIAQLHIFANVSGVNSRYVQWYVCVHLSRHEYISCSSFQWLGDVTTIYRYFYWSVDPIL